MTNPKDQWPGSCGSTIALVFTFPWQGDDSKLARIVIRDGDATIEHMGGHDALGAPYWLPVDIDADLDDGDYCAQDLVTIVALAVALGDRAEHEMSEGGQ